MLTEVREFGIDTENVIFSVIPIGSGNDFSRTLGWGYKNIIFNGEDFDPLIDLVKKWKQAKIVDYDLWDVHIQSYEHGRIISLREEDND